MIDQGYPQNVSKRFIKACEHVKQILSVPYGERQLNDTNRPFVGKKGVVQRPNYGLSHSLRNPSYTQVILQYFIKQQKLDTITLDFVSLSNSDIEKVMIAQLFYMTGRESESNDEPHYSRYLQDSSENFKRYAEKYLNNFYSSNEIEMFTSIIAGHAPYHHLLSTPQTALIRISYALDSVRCKDPEEYASVVNLLNQLFGKEDALNLLVYVTKIMKTTGDASIGVLDVLVDVYTYNEDIFEACNLDVFYCLQQIQFVNPPQPYPIESRELELREEIQGYEQLIAQKGYFELTPLLDKAREKLSEHFLSMSGEQAVHSQNKSKSDIFKVN